MIADFANDIPFETARQAHCGTSFTPEKRAEQERDGYAQTLAADYAMLLKCTEGKPGAVETLNAEFARYREGYRQRTIKHLHSKARCLSWMITGPSNFPTARNEKRNRVEHKRCEELIEFRNRALDAIAKTLCPELRPIMSGDSDAVQRLTEKIQEAEKLQAIMKACNHAIRSEWKNGEAAVIAALVPDEATRSRLKSKGFRWSPTIGAWQAYRHDHTIQTAKIEAGFQPST